MSFLKQLLILAFVPLTAWSGMPHLACRCSNGGIRFFCSRLSLQSRERNSATCRTADSASPRKSCCERSAGTRSAKSSPPGSACRATDCRCTPVCLQNDTAPTLRKVVLPEFVHFASLIPSVTVFRRPRLARVDLGPLKVDPRVPDDLISLCERWLI
jgi:hypothetical protein